MHLVFSTKNRVPFLENRDLRIKTHAYLAGASNKHDCPAIIVNGMADHVHILVRFGREITQSTWVRE
jgi:REP element-mobilizing transposase RayT